MKDTAKIQLGLGNILYWIATAIAILMAISVFADLLVGLAQGDPIVRVVALTAAIAIWLLGRACRFL